MLNTYKSKYCLLYSVDKYDRLMLFIFFLMCTGTSQDIKMAAFREAYSKLYELRSLTALTATATKQTRNTILSLLNMEGALETRESPNKLNVTDVVQYVQKDAELEFYMAGLRMN